jgi:radical SAM/Cys-rich protein
LRQPGSPRLRVLDLPRGPSFDEALVSRGIPTLRRSAVTTLQVNVGKLCNQACHHCHVEAGPKRTEVLNEVVADRIIELLHRSNEVELVDLTGGAPELNAQFQRLVRAARQTGRRVIDRCNLTILFEPGQEHLAAFLAEMGVDVVASLPCYSAGNVEKQRGRGVFDKSVEGLRWLNRLGYGRPGSPLRLDLVYNPLGAFLPPPQGPLEAKYKEELGRMFGIEFNTLLTITNMPIKRFAHALERDGRYDQYMSVLVNHFNPATLPGLMCRTLVSVGWDGRLFDCDFNQMLELDLGGSDPTARPLTIFDITRLSDLAGRPIATAAHCFGCTAGAGSSCGGALT